jgi:hypothetical protein
MSDLKGKLIVEVEEETGEHHVGDDIIGTEALARGEPCEPDTHTHTHTHTHTQSHTLASVTCRQGLGIRV